MVSEDCLHNIKHMAHQTKQHKRDHLISMMGILFYKVLPSCLALSLCYIHAERAGSSFQCQFPKSLVAVVVFCVTCKSLSIEPNVLLQSDFCKQDSLFKQSLPSLSSKFCMKEFQNLLHAFICNELL